jgi:2-polyprenyl-3-methyl-5-hydroxy-6-metoxy-1,4-benzoquinol methylase
MADEFDAAYWETRYRNHAPHGSHPPNPQLVACARQLPPGAALDAGCGEGGNTVWLAASDWRVTAMDVSATALRRARERAESHGADVAARIDWVQADLTAWEPTTGAFDLVAALYVHPAGPRQQLLRRLAAAVARGGTLLIVDHDRSDVNAHAHSSADELTATLDPQGWEIELAETRWRRDTSPRGREITLHDAVLRARRLA